jgi:hypothetical protein
MYLLPNDIALRCVVTPNSPFTEKAIAAAGLGLQQTPIWAKRLTHRRSVDMQRAVHDNRAGPDAVHQLVFRDKLAG